jgi:hypothetical protein
MLNDGGGKRLDVAFHLKKEVLYDQIIFKKLRFGKL